MTFLFTDVEGSTVSGKLSREPCRSRWLATMPLLHAAIASAGGTVFKTVGDAFCAAFATPEVAIEAAVAGQKALSGETPDALTPLKVRMAIHSGQVERRAGDYFGPPSTASRGCWRPCTASRSSSRRLPATSPATVSHPASPCAAWSTRAERPARRGTRLPGHRSRNPCRLHPCARRSVTCTTCRIRPRHSSDASGRSPRPAPRLGCRRIGMASRVGSSKPRDC